MSDQPLTNWATSQQQRLEATGAPRCVDIHCHCLPGLDDGPATLEQSLRLCQALVDDGITSVVATPHQLGRYEGRNDAHQIRLAVSELESALEQQRIPLDIAPGADVRIHERLPQLFLAGEVLTVADANRHILLELPHELMVDPLPTIRALQDLGLQSIVTHPERYRYLREAFEPMRAWIQAGAVFQVTAGSLLGEFGNSAFELAWQLVRENMVELIATDSHDATKRPPRLSAALQQLTKEVGHERASEIGVLNPLKVFEGDTIRSQCLP
jgi:protein-tyrosine phosphatase